VGYKLNVGHDNIIQERAIICISYKWQDGKVRTLTWDKGDDKALLEKFMEVALQADELVAHNGDRFDLKWLRTRCLIHGIYCPPDFTTVDTLKLARGGFTFNSNRLDYLGQLLLGEGKNETGFGLWKDIVLRNCPKAMKTMVRYCEKDVELLQRVHEKLIGYTKHKFNYAVADGGYPWECPECGTDEVHLNKTRTTAAGTIKRQMVCIDKKCRRNFTISNKWYMDFLQWKTEKKHLHR
jgi:hypothetical protein